MLYFHEELKAFLIMNHVVTRGYKKKLEQIQQKKLEVLNAGHLKRIIEEMFPSRMAIMGASIFEFKTKILLKD